MLSRGKLSIIRVMESLKIRTKVFIEKLINFDKQIKFEYEQNILKSSLFFILFQINYGFDFLLLVKFGWNTTVYLSLPFFVWHQICLASKWIMYVIDLEAWHIWCQTPKSVINMYCVNNKDNIVIHCVFQCAMYTWILILSYLILC